MYASILLCMYASILLQSLDVRFGAKKVRAFREVLSVREVLLEATSEIQRPQSEYLFTVGGGLTLDAARMGNATRFMNHSSEIATCNVDAQVVNHRGTRRVVFTANTFIKRGTEMMYDYGSAFVENTKRPLI